MRLQLYRLRQIARRPGNFIVDKIPRLMPSRFFLAFFLKWSVACRASKERNEPFQYSKTRLHAHVCAHIATLRSTRTDTSHTLPSVIESMKECAPIHHDTSLQHNHTCTTDPYHRRPNQTRTRTKQACTSWYKKVARAHTHTHTHTPLRPPHGESTEMCLKSGDEERPAECSPKWAARHNWYAL